VCLTFCLHQTPWGLDTEQGWASSCFVVQTRSLFCLKMTSTAHRMVGLRGVEYGGAGTGFPCVNTYWPTSAPRRGQLTPASRHACQRRFFTEVLLPVVQPYTAGSLVIVGDFNFVADAALDRSTLPSGVASNPDRSAEEATAVQVFTALQTAGHPVEDAFRQLHRQARGYTHSGHNSSARLDLVLLSDELIPVLHRFWVGAGRGSHSDHMSWLCSLLPRVAPVSLHPQWRAPTAVLEPADLVERLTVWIKRTVEVHLPLTDAELVAHWPTVKAGFRQEICYVGIPGPNTEGSPPVLAL
jgi:exonuclease III